jgi:hypothetical protein
VAQYRIDFVGGPVDGLREDLDDVPGAFEFKSALSGVSHRYEYDKGATSKDGYQMTAIYTGINEQPETD